jgi:hypothetical protein
MFSSLRSAIIAPLASRSFSTGPTFNKFAVNKVKAAVQFSFVRPVVETKTSKTSLPYHIVKSNGAVRLEFAAANPETAATSNGKQNRTYNWAKKQTLHLSCNEIGDLLAFGETPVPDAELKLYHDPSKGSEGEGKVRKELIIKHAPNNKGVYFNFSSSVKDEGKTTIMCALTPGEFKVLRVLLERALPDLMGMSSVAPTTENDQH